MGRKRRPDTKTVRVHVDVATMIDTCAAAERVDTPEWLSNLLRPILQKRLPEAVAKLLHPPDGPGKNKKKS